ncbi:amidohydrolase family protein [uncultured Propionivibrio sp.]|uniref:amidohydrolase family protein n=1 Tax=uncultured Propionivibrio sp. TaxID=426737 RepID=UPI0029C0D105|nr:amidohydrolase family protein [uncultured Propionivibrio sp.]
MDRRQFNLGLLGLGAASTLPLGLAACATGATGEKRSVTGIDTHAHVFHRGLPFVPNRRYTPDYDALPADYLRMLDSNGMSHGVIVPISILGTNNDYTLEVIRQSGGRVRGLAVIDPAKDIGKLDALNAGGIVGIRLNLIGKPVDDMKSSVWRELVATCRRLDWQIEVYDDASRLAQTVTPLIDQGAKVVVDHFGKPDVGQGISDPGFKYLLGVAATRQVWVKLSAPYRSSDAIAADAAPLLLKAFGPERLVWGSDWPHTAFEGKVSHRTLRAQLDGWVPDAEARRIILTETPAKLFRF